MILTHSGDLGDLIYSLPAIRAVGGATLHLFNSGKTMFPMNEQRFAVLEPLLRAQPYITNVELVPTQRPSTFNNFRDFGPIDCNLADRHLFALGIRDRSHRNSQWLTGVTLTHAAEIVICRSARYQNPLFPWRAIVEKYGKRIRFLGTREEWISFCNYVQWDIEYIATDNLLQAASIIRASRLFIGNQTCLTAIAEGLKHRMIIEQNREGAKWSCFWQRENLIMGWDDSITLPEI